MSDTPERERRRYETALVWLRRDLRLHDHPASIVEHGAARALVLATYGQAAEDGKRVTSAE